MLRISRVRRCLALLLALGPGLPSPAGAAGWTSRPAGEAADSAGFFENGAFEGLWFSCQGEAKGRARLIFPGFDMGLQRDLDRTVVVTVDDTAFRQTTRAEDNLAERAGDLVRTAEIAAFAELIAALKTGKKAEIASPNGRRTIALKGAGKALSAFEAGCR